MPLNRSPLLSTPCASHLLNAFPHSYLNPLLASPSPLIQSYSTGPFKVKLKVYLTHETPLSPPCPSSVHEMGPGSPE